MGRVADSLDAVIVRAVSPDRNIGGELCNRTTIRIVFLDDSAYGRYPSEPALAAQISKVLSTLLKGRGEGYRKAIREVSSLTIDDSPHWDSVQRRFRQERDSAVITGVSACKRISVASAALRDTAVIITPRTLDSLSSGQFISALDSAVSNMWNNWGWTVNDLRAKHFGQTIRIRRPRQ